MRKPDVNKFDGPNPGGEVRKKKRSLPSEIVMGMQNLADQDDADLSLIVGVEVDDEENGNDDETVDTQGKKTEP